MGMVLEGAAIGAATGGLVGGSALAIDCCADNAWGIALERSVKTVALVTLPVGGALGGATVGAVCYDRDGTKVVE